MKDTLWQLIQFPGQKGKERSKKRIHPAVLWAIAVAIIFLAVGGLDSKEKVQPNEENADVSAEVYIRSLEKRLQDTLQKINGAGKVSVFISMESGGEKILATDRVLKSQQEDQSGSRTEEERKIVLQGKSAKESPYVVKERFPEPAGVLVVAEGAQNETVRYEIYQAIRALFGLPAHRIQISY